MSPDGQRLYSISFSDMIFQTPGAKLQTLENPLSTFGKTTLCPAAGKYSLNKKGAVEPLVPLDAESNATRADVVRDGIDMMIQNYQQMNADGRYDLMIERFRRLKKRYERGPTEQERVQELIDKLNKNYEVNVPEPESTKASEPLELVKFGETLAKLREDAMELSRKARHLVDNKSTSQQLDFEQRVKNVLDKIDELEGVNVEVIRLDEQIKKLRNEEDIVDELEEAKKMKHSEAIAERMDRLESELIALHQIHMRRDKIEEILKKAERLRSLTENIRLLTNFLEPTATDEGADDKELSRDEMLSQMPKIPPTLPPPLPSKALPPPKTLPPYRTFLKPVPPSQDYEKRTYIVGMKRLSELLREWKEDQRIKNTAPQQIPIQPAISFTPMQDNMKKIRQQEGIEIPRNEFDAAEPLFDPLSLPEPVLQNKEEELQSDLEKSIQFFRMLQRYGAMDESDGDTEKKPAQQRESDCSDLTTASGTLGHIQTL